MSTKKKTPVKKATASLKKAVVTKKAAPAKKAASIIKQNVIAKKAAPKKPVSKKVAPKKGSSSSKKPAVKPFEDAVTKEALKLVDQASSMLRDAIKTSHKTTAKARTATHKQAHNLLGKATRHLDDAIKSGSAMLTKIINKI